MHAHDLVLDCQQCCWHVGEVPIRNELCDDAGRVGGKPQMSYRVEVRKNDGFCRGIFRLVMEVQTFCYQNVLLVVIEVGDLVCCRIRQNNLKIRLQKLFQKPVLSHQPQPTINRLDWFCFSMRCYNPYIKPNIRQQNYIRLVVFYASPMIYFYTYESYEANFLG